jgi:transposase
MAHRGLARAQKKARLEHRELVLVDEAGFYLLPSIVRTYAPCAHTPVLRVLATHDHLSVMSGVSLGGGLYTMVRKHSLRAVESVWFLKHLLRCLGPKLLVIWDGSPIHRGEEVQSFLADGGAKRVHLEQLPPYAPDLNPDEGVWKHLKYVEMRNLCCADLTHLHHELHLAIARLRRQPQLIQSFFAGAGLVI